MDTRLNAPWIALRFALGLTATLAGLDKFFNLLADWGTYVSPLARNSCPSPRLHSWESWASSRSPSVWPF